MVLTDEWFTTLGMEGDQLIYISGRVGIDGFAKSGKLKTRVEIVWTYTPDNAGMPQEGDVRVIAEIEAILRRTMERDKLAILTGNHLGVGAKHWVFYTRHLPSFQDRLNECLSPYPLLPLQIECWEDTEWEEYYDMLSMRQDEDED